ncbi:MAG: type II toxin-antitoxin system RelE/ParE family toxin [Clostridiales bacterium]|jgi:plasmid stabilization system protein ParE|nr:type II toxin-antitoxin system RelE/ParE family toxin [Clostridiales bacterium]
MGSKLSYRFAPKALGDLEETLRYIEQDLSNPKAAEDLAVKLFEKIDTVRAFPDSGHKVENVYMADRSLRRFVVDNYVVFYKPDEAEHTIIIVRIVFGARNLNEILKQD